MDIIKKVISDYGTPLYLYNEALIEKKYDILSGALLPDSKIFYSMKANPLLGICQVLVQKGCGVEVASKCEMELAMRSGCRAKNIIFTGPGKTIDELDYAVKTGIKCINIESLKEAKIIDACACKYKTVTDIFIRINPNRLNDGAKIKMSGVPSQFGIDESQISDTFFSELNLLKNIRVIGLQIYMGTQILDASEICINTEYAINLAMIWKKRFGVTLECLDFGGGFGIPYFPKEHPLDIQNLKTGMNALFEKYWQNLEGMELIFESGRFLVAESGLYIVRVLYDKISRGQRYIICDGGSNFFASSAFLGRFVRNNFPMSSIPDSNEKENMTVAGPLCTPTDVIGQCVSLNKNITAGDYIVIEKSGAYGVTHSPLMFLSHERPTEVIYNSDGIVRVLRERGSIKDFLDGQGNV